MIVATIVKEYDDPEDVEPGQPFTSRERAMSRTTYQIATDADYSPDVADDLARRVYGMLADDQRLLAHLYDGEPAEPSQGEDEAAAVLRRLDAGFSSDETPDA